MIISLNTMVLHDNITKHPPPPAAPSSPATPPSTANLVDQQMHTPLLQVCVLKKDIFIHYFCCEFFFIMFPLFWALFHINYIFFITGSSLPVISPSTLHLISKPTKRSPDTGYNHPVGRCRDIHPPPPAVTSTARERGESTG